LGDPSVGWTSVPSPIKNAKRLEKNEWNYPSRMPSAWKKWMKLSNILLLC
jgi:hypothetical protein